MGSIQFRKIAAEELTPALFSGFRRFQVVKRCWRETGGRWELRDVPFTEDWDEKDYQRLCPQLQATVREGGAVLGLFICGQQKGFAAVEGKRIGSRRQYAVLSEMYISSGYRGKGLGRQLFQLAADFARGLGAEKLYISAMSAEESMAFYLAMGCVGAEEKDPAHVEKEPCDCQMEYPL